MKLTAPMMRVLERAFAQEVQHALAGGKLAHLPVQVGKSKAVQRCVEAGLLAPREAQLGSALGPIYIAGHDLTEAGRIAYCATCTEDDEP